MNKIITHSFNDDLWPSIWHAQKILVRICVLAPSCGFGMLACYLFTVGIWIITEQHVETKEACFKSTYIRLQRPEVSNWRACRRIQRLLSPDVTYITAFSCVVAASPAAAAAAANPNRCPWSHRLFFFIDLLFFKHLRRQSADMPMYQVKPVCGGHIAIDVPTCMYKLSNIHAAQQGNSCTSAHAFQVTRCLATLLLRLSVVL